MTSDMDVQEGLAAPLEVLPQVEFAFAYGSGVFHQPGYSNLAKKEAPMVDYILGVKTPILWHSENIERNPHHYNSWLAYFGGKGVSTIAEKLGAGVHFNAFVPWRGKMIKYGVISMENLAQDILSWQTLYISGRLHKPVHILIDNWDLAKVNQVNLHAAASAALLLLPAQFSEEELYNKICSLSYMGDVRMMFAENRNKVHNIVQGSAEHFHSLYRMPLCHIAALGLLELPNSFGDPKSVLVRIVNYDDIMSFCGGGAAYLARCGWGMELPAQGGGHGPLPRTAPSQDCRPHALESFLSSLPKAVLDRIAPTASLPTHTEKGVHVSGDPARAVERAIRSVVRRSSTRQVLAGMVAAGGVNSLRYVWSKVSKAWRQA